MTPETPTGWGEVVALPVRARPEPPAPPPPEVPAAPTETTSRLRVALALRGIEPSDLATEFVGWHAIDVARDRMRAALGEFPFRASLGPTLEPIDEARLEAILGGALPTDGEAATLSDALGGAPWPREFFRRPPLPVATHVHACGGGIDTACACGAPATLLCDEITGEGREGTCDQPVCAGCASEIGPEEHRCPKHKPSPRLTDAPWMGVR